MSNSPARPAPMAPSDDASPVVPRPKPPPVTTISEAVERFKQVRGHFCYANVIKNKKAKINPYQFQVKANEHYAHYKITDTIVNSDTQIPSVVPPPSTPNIVVNHVATFDQNHFFQDPNNPAIVFSCCDDATYQHFIEKNFNEIGVAHFTLGADIPSPLPLPTPTDLPTPAPTVDIIARLAPTVLTLPPSFQPKLWTLKGKTTAWAIQHAIHTKVYDRETDTCYSPYKLWTLEARKAAGHVKKNESLSKYMAIYYILQVIYKGDASLCTGNIASLYKQAAEYRNSVLNNPKDFDWFQAALSVSPKCA